ncbi:MAG: ATP-binding protein [Rhodoferax sp.]
MIIRSIRWRIATMIILGMGLLAMAVFWSSKRSHDLFYAENIRETIAQTSRLVNMAVAPVSTTPDISSLSEFLAEIMANDGSTQNGLSYLVIVDQHQRRLINAGQVPKDLPTPDASPEMAASRGLINIRQPLLLTGGQIGYLQYGYSTYGQINAAQRVQREAVLLTVLGTLLLGTVFAVVGLRLARRIERLTAVARAFELGNLAFRADEAGDDELSELARHFNGMATAIDARIKELESTKGELADLNSHLEEKVGQRTMELSAKSSELETNLRELKLTRDHLIRTEKLAGLGNLVAGVAHELNTPIGNALLGSSSLIDRTWQFETAMASGLKKSALIDYLTLVKTSSDIIGRNLNRAATLITSFKQIAVNQTSEQRLKFSLKEAMTALVQALSPSFKRLPYTLDLAIADDLVLTSYPGSLEQVVTNLVNNALIHAFEGRDSGTMRLSARQINHGQVEVKFEDDGKGIAVDVIPRIFDPFFSTRFGQGGSGLGLHIVHNIVTMILEGSINVSSTQGCGTCFTLVLPLVVADKRNGTSIA